MGNKIKGWLFKKRQSCGISDKQKSEDIKLVKGDN